MSRIVIDSIDDPRLAPYRDLNKSNLCRVSGLFIVEGRTLVLRMLRGGWPTHSVLTSARCDDKIGPSVPPGVPRFVVSRELISQIVGYHFHRGALACGRRRAPSSVEDVLSARAGPKTLAVCPYVQDSANLGGILRNAAAFGVDGILLGRRCADPFSRRVVRVSMGAVFSLRIAECEDLRRDLVRLRDKSGVELIATVLDESAEPLETAKRTGCVALLFGSEGFGLERQWIDLCRRRVTIPMQLGTDSLNVATTSGIFFYHFTREARSAGRSGRF